MLTKKFNKINTKEYKQKNNGIFPDHESAQ